MRPRGSLRQGSLLAVPGIEPFAEAPIVYEFAVKLPLPAELVVERMAEEGFLAGLPVEVGGESGLLVAVTEKRTRSEIDAYVAAMEKVVS